MASNFITFEIDGNNYIFSVDRFRTAFGEMKQKKRKRTGKYSSTNLMYDIAEYVNVSEETVKKWYSGANGPGDIEKVKDLAKFFGLHYMDLLHRKESAIMEIEYNYKEETERDIILAVYRKIIEIIWLETSRYKEEYSKGIYQEDDVFWKRWKELYGEAYLIVDTNSLDMPYESRVKLYNILTETKKSMDSDGMNAPARWKRLNDLIFTAREYYLYGGFAENEDELIEELYRDIQSSMERPYKVDCEVKHGNYTQMISLGGFHKDTKKEEYLERAKGLGAALDQLKLESLDDEDFGYHYDPAEVYRFEFIKTILLVFREEFPQYF